MRSVVQDRGDKKSNEDTLSAHLKSYTLIYTKEYAAPPLMRRPTWHTQT